MTSVDVSRDGRIVRSCAQIPTENCWEADTVTSPILEVPVVTLCTTRFKNSTFCPHSVFVWFEWLSEQSLFPYTKKSESSFPSTAARCPKGHCYLKGLQDSSVCPCNSDRQMKMCLEYWRNDTDRGKPKTSEKNLPRCHYSHDRSRKDWSGIEPEPPRSGARDWPPFPYTALTDMVFTAQKKCVYYAIRTESLNTIPTDFRLETVNSYGTNLLSLINSNMGVLSFVTQNSGTLNTFCPFQQNSPYRNLSPSTHRTLIPMWFQGETTNPQGGCISTVTQPFMAAKHKLYASTKRKKPEASLINRQHKNWFMNTTPSPKPAAYTYVWRTPTRTRTSSIKCQYTTKHIYEIIWFNRSPPPKKRWNATACAGNLRIH
jgi:hypothetical protein